jgi:hypothetical protein
LRIPLKEHIGGESRLKDRVTLQRTLLGVGFGYKRLACTMGIDVPRKSHRIPIKVLASRRKFFV